MFISFFHLSLSVSISYSALLPSTHMKGKSFLWDDFTLEWKSKIIRQCKNDMHIAVMLDLPYALNKKRLGVVIAVMAVTGVA